MSKLFGQYKVLLLLLRSNGGIFYVLRYGQYISVDSGLVRSQRRLVFLNLKYKSPILSREATYSAPTLQLCNAPLVSHQPQILEGCPPNKTYSSPTPN